MDAPSAEKTYWGQKTQAPSAKPLLSTLHWSIPLPQFSTWHPSSQKVMCQMSSAGSFLRKSASHRGITGFGSRGQEGFQGSTTMKRPQLCHGGTIQSSPSHCHFSIDKHHKHFSLKPALPLWMIEVLWITRLLVTAIIDSGCQVIIIRKDIGKDWNAMKHKQVMFMELAMDNPMHHGIDP